MELMESIGKGRKRQDNYVKEEGRHCGSLETIVVQEDGDGQECNRYVMSRCYDVLYKRCRFILCAAASHSLHSVTAQHKNGDSSLPPHKPFAALRAKQLEDWKFYAIKAEVARHES